MMANWHEAFAFNKVVDTCRCWEIATQALIAAPFRRFRHDTILKFCQISSSQTVAKGGSSDKRTRSLMKIELNKNKREWQKSVIH